MKIKINIVIDADRETVWQTLDSSDNTERWQPMLQTVTERRKPDFLAGTYESTMGNAVVVNHFEDAGDGTTRWNMYANHQFRGIYRLIGIFLASSIRKRNEDVMNKFKLFTETEAAGRVR
jgi:uncharacterized protein YndB with AHSA1/START domain